MKLQSINGLFNKKINFFLYYFNINLFISFIDPLD